VTQTSRAAQRRSARVRAVCLAAGLLAAADAGCGKKGPPLPPLGHRPEPPAKIEARQVDEDLVLEFDLPVHYTDGDALAGPPAVRLLRDSLGGPPVLVHRFAPETVGAAPGARASLALPIALAFEGVTSSSATFRVETQGPKGKPSASSAPIAVTRETPLPTPTALKAGQGADGIELEWTADAGALPALEYNVYRRTTADADWGKPLNPAPLGSARFMDRDAITGSLYTYRVETVIAAARPPRASAPSEPVEIRRRDETPPDAPTEVRAVAGADGIRLFWFAPVATDVAALRVYRASSGGPLAPLADLPRDATFYLDRDVAPGVSYTYCVTALDGASPPNESQQSATASETPPAEPLSVAPPGD